MAARESAVNLSLFQESSEFRGARGILRENRFQVASTQLLVCNFGKYVAKIGGNGDVPTLIELVRFHSFPVPKNLSAFDGVANDEHRVAVPMIGAAAAILAGCPAEFRHGEYDHVVHSLTQIGRESRDRLAEGPQIIG